MKTALRSFAGGEITPELVGRLDLTKYQTGLALCRNFITLPHGPAARRAGLEFINEAKDSTQAVRLVPFSFNAEQTAVLEFGHQYIRFHIEGGTVLEDAKTVEGGLGTGTLTITAHGYATGDWLYIVNGYYKITVTDADTFNVLNLDGTAAIILPGGSVTAQRVYTVATPYAAADLFDINYAQDSDVLTLVHPSYPAKELARLGATNWTLTDISFAPPSDAPTGVAVVPTVADPSNPSPQSYVVTAVGADGVTESLASTAASATNNLTLAGNYNTVTWNAVNGASRYNVYKKRGGVFGYIGQVRPAPVSSPVNIDSIARGSDSRTVTVTTDVAHGRTLGDTVLIQGTGVGSFDSAWVITEIVDTDTFRFESTKKGFNVSSNGTVTNLALSLIDDNVLASDTQSPPEDIITLNDDSNSYPGATTYHEQRRWFAGTNEKPQTMWGTRTGTVSNLTSSLPSQDADAMELRLAAVQNNRIRHLVPLSDMIALTAGGEFRIFSDNAPAITPTSVSIKPQAYAGSASVQPVVTTGSILYVQAQGSRVREMAYSWESSAYRTVDMSIMAPHRFTGFTIKQMAFARAPDAILWAVRNDGVLLGLTYVPDQQVYGWHAHDTDGAVESVCTVAEDNEDAVYIVVRRTVGVASPRTVRYVERMRQRTFLTPADAFFVDSGLTYQGTPTTTISGLKHLNGKDVSVLADGAVHPPRQVLNGTITLEAAASKVTVGLPYTSDMQTLPLVLEGMQAAGQGTTKNVSRVHLRVSRSSVVRAGPSFDQLVTYQTRSTDDNYNSPPALLTEEIQVPVAPSWTRDGAVCVRQDAPLPLTVLSMALELQTGG
jgi:hypothetical protein